MQWQRKYWSHGCMGSDEGSLVGLVVKNPNSQGHSTPPWQIKTHLGSLVGCHWYHNPDLDYCQHWRFVVKEFIAWLIENTSGRWLTSISKWSVGKIVSIIIMKGTTDTMVFAYLDRNICAWHLENRQNVSCNLRTKFSIWELRNMVMKLSDSPKNIGHDCITCFEFTQNTMHERVDTNG